LPDSEKQAISSVGVDGDHVGSNDGELVADERDLKVVLRRHVDDAQAVTLARGQGHLGILTMTSLGMNTGTVEENVVAERWTVALSVVHQLIRALVVVIHKRERAKVDVIGQRSWTVNDDGTDNAIAILSREVRVVPAGAILLGTEAIGTLAAVGRDGAFSNAVGAIVKVAALLVNAVPVDGSAMGVSLGTSLGEKNKRIPIGQKVVDDLDFDPVTPVGLNGRACKG
jgi:hypothetical protein